MNFCEDESTTRHFAAATRQSRHSLPSAPPVCLSAAAAAAAAAAASACCSMKQQSARSPHAPLPPQRLPHPVAFLNSLPPPSSPLTPTPRPPSMEDDPSSPSVRFDLPSTVDDLFSPTCNPEIIAYSPNASLPVTSAHVGKFLAVQVAAAHLTTSNAGLRTRHLWGGENGVCVSRSSPRRRTACWF